MTNLSPTRPNTMLRMVQKVQAIRWLPAGAQQWLLTQGLRRAVPLVGTARVDIDELTPNRVVGRLRNRRRVRNHIHGIHAVGAALLGETCTGFVMGLNVPDDKILLIRSLQMDYVRVMKGDLCAVATLSDEQRQMIWSSDKGELPVSLVVTDESGESPVVGQMLWAWRSKDMLKK